MGGPSSRATPLANENGHATPPDTGRSFASSGGSFSNLLEGPRELWIIYLLKIFVSFVYFVVFSVLTLYLTEDFGMTDFAVGWVYGLHGALVGIWGMLIGAVSDKIGWRRSVIIGTVCHLVAHGLITFTHNGTVCLIGLLVLKPPGTALCVPTLAIPIRRFTTPKSRPFGFSLFHMSQNLAAVLSALTISAARHWEVGHIRVQGTEQWSLWRLVIATALIVDLLQLLLVICVRDSPQESSPNTILAMRRAASPLEIASEVVTDPKFVRFAMVILVLVGVRSAYRHLDATFPKYVIRSFGADAEFELFLIFNPLTILVMIPLATNITQHLELGYKSVLFIGALFTGVAPFILMIETSLRACIFFVIFLSVGDAIGSPKLYEYSVAVAPVGREASYAALSSLPLFLAAMFIGGFSGHLLETHCAEVGHCHGEVLWFWVGLSTITSPLLLLVLSRFIFKSSDLWEDRNAGILLPSARYTPCSPAYGALSPRDEPYPVIISPGRDF